MRAEKKRRPSRYRPLTEAGLTILCLLAVVRWVPLGSRGFQFATAGACLGLVGYLTYTLARDRGAWVRWGLLPGDGDDGVDGCLSPGVLYLVALFPIGAARFLVQLPYVPHPVGYLVWCAAQDFVFFCLILRNLEDLTHP